MENYEKETIAAIATALSDSGIGIVRISGENAIYIVDSIFRSASGKKILTKVQSHMIHYGYIVDKDENIIDAVKRIKRYGVNGVKLLLPQKLNAKITFGFEDPYYTGKVLGWIAALIPIYGDHIDITPDFEKRILKGELKIKGRIRRYKILYLLWKVYKDKDELIKQKDRAIRMIGGS